MNQETVVFNENLYILDKQIGEGDYGQVWVAIKGDEKFVVKKVVVNLQFDDDDDAEGYWGDDDKYAILSKRKFLRETKLAKYVTKQECPTFIKYLDVAKGLGGTRYILMEYFPGHNFTTLIHCQKKSGFILNPDQFLIMASHLFRGLACLHNIGVVHGDLTSNNIMFNNKGMKIVDFGLLCTVPPFKPYYSCYIDHNVSEDYRERPWAKKNEYPFQRDVLTLSQVLKNVMGENFKIKYEKDPRINEIIEWLHDLTKHHTHLPKYTAQEALIILDKIPVKEELSSININ